MKRKKYKTLSPPIDFWLLSSIFLVFILFGLLFLLIQERQFLVNMQIYLEKYQLTINKLSNFNAKISSGHLSLTTNPSSSSNIIYLTPESYTYKK
jgi:hypothetical protein